MRSIRRTSIGYLLVLLVLALGGVSLLIDQFARDAIRAREASEGERIAAVFERRREEATTKFDVELRAETKGLGRVLAAVIRSQQLQAPQRDRFRAIDEDAADYRLRVLAFQIETTASPIPPAVFVNALKTSTWS